MCKLVFITIYEKAKIAHLGSSSFLLGRYNFALQLSDLVCVFRSDVDPLKQHYIVLCPEVELDGLSVASTTFR